MPILPNERRALAALKSFLEANYGLRAFRIYGSKAKGTDVPESDLDVMIELEASSPTIESQIDDLIFELNLEHDCFITAVYYSREELEHGPLSESPLYWAILRHGISL
jgi:predicted nucleotidyltransferase